ncbi:hypothetical protein LBMAG18_12970 [Alphaproteobacteria bacterium]|nr:hypothetical protein LBMAG18_12970 [Alphaproteobacteria bacterium]
MTDQENNNIKKVVDKYTLRYLRKKGTKNGLDLNSDNFEKNLIEIVSNPNSQYAENVYLFDKIPELKAEEKTLNGEIKTLKSDFEKLNLEINGKEGVKGLKALIAELEKQKLDLENQINGYYDQSDGDNKEGLEDVVAELTKQRDVLKKQIDGDDKNFGLSFEVERLKNKRDALKKEIDGDETSEDKLVKDGLLAYRDTLYNQIHSKDGLENKRNSLNTQIKDLTKKNSIVENLSELKKEARSNIIFYYWCVGGMVVLIIISSYFAYLYGKGIIDDITKITNKDSRDYFGMFLMKIPFSLMIITFISGGFIFISKLLVIIERINNQLRNISQISVIASQIDQGAIDLINRKSGKDETELEEAKTKKEEKNLFYNLIAEYLVNLSKNELEIKEKKGSQLNMLKELAEIIHKVKPSSKE